MNINVREQRLFPNVPGTRSRNTKRKSIAAWRYQVEHISLKDGKFVLQANYFPLQPCIFQKSAYIFPDLEVNGTHLWFVLIDVAFITS